MWLHHTIESVKPVSRSERSRIMNFNDLLTGKDINPQDVIVMRRRPREAPLRKVLPWLAAERPDLFNAYQQTQRETVEKTVLTAKYVDRI